MNQQLLKIESYSKAFAEKVCNNFFINKEEINGEEILSLTSIDQVNLFILKNLFDRWRDEVFKLRSPYFDYDNAGVKEGISQFMNILSRHILIKKEFFRPLVENATYETLTLLIEPSVFLKSELGRDGLLAVEDFKGKKKFFKVYREFWDKISQSNKSAISIAELQVEIESEFQKLQSVREEYLVKFSNILPLEIINSETEIKEKNQASVIIERHENVTIEKAIEEPKEPIKEDSPTKDNISNIINEKFATPQLTINEILAQNQSKTVADQIRKSKLDNIKSAISLNQKFQFINYLFLGQAGDYESALNEIEKCSSFDQALTLLNQNYAAKYHWDYNKAEVSDFIALVEQRFI